MNGSADHDQRHRDTAVIKNVIGQTGLTGGVALATSTMSVAAAIARAGLVNGSDSRHALQAVAGILEEMQGVLAHETR